MNINTNNQTIKKLIKQELPGLMKKDRKIREWILQLTKEQLTEKANEIETKTESKFDRLLEELKKDREEQARKWDELKMDLQRDREEQNKKWEENQKEIRKLYDALEKYWKDSNRKYNTTVGALGARWGLRSESSFRNALKGILEDLDLRVEHIDDYDEEGMVYGQPSSVEIDIIIKNGLLMICELKSSISKAEMFTFYKKTLFYEKKYHRRGDRLIVISPMVEIKAREAAEQLGIKVYSYAEDIQEEL
ncbi:MAG: DUF3782 domain-containing protein [Candidatus Aminicenantes bacterium]|nr:MAG: DUF3782 domain-containing protein [Candidatus Aminicenantes bacterium]